MDRSPGKKNDRRRRAFYSDNAGPASARLPSVQKRRADFKDSLTDGENTAREFEAVLRRNAKEKTPDSATAGKAYQRAHAACLQCHAKYRDAPQKPRAVLAVAFEGLQHHR
jgi:cytochrome c556